MWTRHLPDLDEQKNACCAVLGNPVSPVEWAPVTAEALRKSEISSALRSDGQAT